MGLERLARGLRRLTLHLRRLTLRLRRLALGTVTSTGKIFLRSFVIKLFNKALKNDRASYRGPIQMYPWIKPWKAQVRKPR